ncbi:hypothetical protein EW146_g5223, partial [Bondarzewia mesenterica]
MASSQAVKDFADAFVKISFQEERDGDPAFNPWVDQGSAKHSYPELLLSRQLQKLYPGHSLVMSADYRLDLLGFPGAYIQPLSPAEVITNKVFLPLPKRTGPVPGLLLDSVEFGAFKVAWKHYDFTLYIARKSRLVVQWPVGFGVKTQYFILHEGPETPANDLLLSAGIYEDQLHNEIWVFNQGFWNKDAGLWQDVQKADWSDVILEEDFKVALQKDVYSFFSSEGTYKKLSLPWKRGLILYGPPGNGKTISIKAIMKTCDAKGYNPMYVRSFKSWMGDEGSMAAVFNKARQTSPCVLILEDLDSLINDSNRSFFLNELDGLKGNDGLLVIGTTNHFDRLDPGLSTRPSRFDRKYLLYSLFDDPNLAARTLYVQYWQEKLKDNQDVVFPDSLVKEIAETTDRFSFAYLKEAFVSALVVLLADQEGGTKTSFENVIKSQIKTLRKQLDKDTLDRFYSPYSSTASTSGSPENKYAALFDSLVAHLQAIPPLTSQGPRQASSSGSSIDIPKQRIPGPTVGPILPPSSDNKDIRALFEGISHDGNEAILASFNRPVLIRINSLACSIYDSNKHTESEERLETVQSQTFISCWSTEFELSAAAMAPAVKTVTGGVDVEKKEGVQVSARDIPNETVNLVEDIIRSQLVELIVQARALANRRGARYLSAEDLIFLIRHDRAKVNRLRTYLSWKDVRKHAKDSNADGGGGVEVETLEDGADDKLTAKAQKITIKLPWEITTIFSEVLRQSG